MDTISYDDFKKIDLRTGTVTKAEKVAKADELLKLEVDFGPLGLRTIVSGLAKSWMPESIVGEKVLAVVNLAPRKLFGIESQGMILAVESGSGQSLLLPHCPGAPNGNQVG
jgi:methionyl-tRNA synthetase